MFRWKNEINVARHKFLFFYFFTVKIVFIKFIAGVLFVRAKHFLQSNCGRQPALLRETFVISVYLTDKPVYFRMVYRNKRIETNDSVNVLFVQRTEWGGGDNTPLQNKSLKIRKISKKIDWNGPILNKINL